MSVLDPLFDFCADSHKAGLGLINTWLQGAQRVRQHQLEQISAALSSYEHLSRQPDAVRDASGLQAMQQTLVSSQIERSMAYWSGLASMLGQNQIELAQEARSSALQMAECLCQSAGEMTPVTLLQPVASSLGAAINAVSVGLLNAHEQAQAGPDRLAGRQRGSVTAVRGKAAPDDASVRAALKAVS